MGRVRQIHHVLILLSACRRCDFCANGIVNLYTLCILGERTWISNRCLVAVYLTLSSNQWMSRRVLGNHLNTVLPLLSRLSASENAAIRGLAVKAISALIHPHTTNSQLFVPWAKSANKGTNSYISPASLQSLRSILNCIRDTVYSAVMRESQVGDRLFSYLFDADETANFKMILGMTRGDRLLDEIMRRSFGKYLTSCGPSTSVRLSISGVI